MAQIELVHVHKTYGGRKPGPPAVSDLSYTIGDGEFVSLLGPSGCGKSTTLNMIAGLEEISSGEILIDGARVDELDPDQRDLAFVFQDYALYPHMNVYDNIAFGLRMRRVDKPEIDRRVHDAARRLDIEHVLRTKPRNLSGGQRQRVALARAIGRRPAVFLFDEPLSNLDALLRDQTRGELKLLHAELGATSVYVTHDQEEAMTLSDRIVVMSKGKLEQYGTPYEIYHEPRTEFVASFVGKPRMNILSAVRDGDQGFRVAGSPLMMELGRIGQKTVRLGLRPEECRLEVVGTDDEAHGRVKVVQPLGNATDVGVDLGGDAGTDLFTVRVPGFDAPAISTPVRIDSGGATRHVFDSETGTRIYRS